MNTGNQSSPADTRSPGPESDAAVDGFIARWTGKDGGERSNYQLFISELCDLIEVPRPNPSSSDNTENAYVFEKRVETQIGVEAASTRLSSSQASRFSRNQPKRQDAASTSNFEPGAPNLERGKTAYGFIDCYKRGCFVFETKQGVEKKDREALSEIVREREAKRRTGHGVRGTVGWDTALLKARNQAERYARNLPPSEGRPPFLIVADVGHTIELYAEFTRTGGIYSPFPPGSHRIHLTDLRRPGIRERLRLVWTDPLSLDPARRTAAVTRGVAAKLAALAKSLEADGHDPQLAAYFLMRCIFTMFAEDVELLPKGGFGEMLKSLRGQVQVVPSMLEQLWKAMDTGEFFPVMWFRQKLLRFNGGLFREPRALAITDDQLELLIEAAKADWRDVEPAIFGTLLERALDPTERHKLGAHYTPRAYVERLVLPTVIEPLRADWQAVQAAAAQLANEGKEKQALAEIEKFHRHLCHVRVLDPACGTGNFLYVTLEHLKRLEGEVLDALERFGGNRSLEMDTATVRPGQMRGIEINPRAAVIAELVLWIGYLQWHLRTAGDVKTVSEPVLEDAKNIETRDAILAYDSKEPIRVEAASSRFSEDQSKRQDAASTLDYAYFNPLREVKITEANLPHWRQEGVTYFVTFRLADSLPQERLQQWQAERDEWLARNPTPHTDEQKADYFDRFSARMEMWLDAGHGACCLQDPACRTIVESALQHFDGERYTLGKFAVARNHVHAIVTPKDGHELSDIIHSWKSYTANEINKHLGRTGAVWQKEFYDQIVRSSNAAYRIEQYIDGHPKVEAASSLKNVEVASSRFSSEDKRQDGASTQSPIFLTRWDGRTTKPHPVTGRPVPDEHAQLPIYSYENPRPASWPKADFIVGNPPFIGASRMRDALGDGYVEAVRKTIKAVPESADFVMYWWNHAADLVRQGQARRFGFVTTNSLRQTFNRRVLEQHLKVEAASTRLSSSQASRLSSPKVAHASSVSSSPDKGPKTKDQGPLSLLFAIPDHPWVDDVEAAAVRVAMTVAEAGNASGLLQTVESEEPGDESFKVAFNQRVGMIAADLTIGADTTSAAPLQSNERISSRGVQVIGAGFIVSPDEAKTLGLGRTPGVDRHIRQYLNGRDLTASPRGVMVIDLFGLTAEEVRTKFPEIYQWLYERVKPERDQNKRASYKRLWWIHGEPRGDFRPSLDGLTRYIATVETSKHRFFQFLDTSILPDNKLVNIALEDAYHLGILSSRLHLAWAAACGSLLEDRPVYVKSTCFETFPFPDCTEAQKSRIRELGEALDAHRKSRQAAHPDLRITGMYNVLEKLRSVEVPASRDRFSEKGKQQDAASTALTAKEKTIHEQGLVSILKQLHDDLDAAVLDAYGWNDLKEDLASGSSSVASAKEEEILTRLVALNHARAEEEKRGLIRWLRPEYQTAGLPSEASAKDGQKPEQAEFEGVAAASKPLQQAQGGQKTPSTSSGQARTTAEWPKALPNQIAAVRSALETLSGPADATAIAKLFKGARKDRIEAILESLQALGHAHEVEDGRYSA